MYIFKNALRCIRRAKGRNFLIGLIVVLLSVSSCIGLSIKEANKTLKNQYLNDMEISATVTSKSRENELTLDNITELSADKSVKSSYKTASLYFSAGDGIEPIDVSGSFKKNKDFKDKYGDIKNGESQTTTEKGEATVIGTSLTAKSKIELLSEQKEPEIQEEQEKTEKDNEDSKPQKPDGDNLPEDDKSANKGENGNSSQSTPPTPPQMKDGDTFITNKFFFNMASMNDFTVKGCDNENALPDYVSSLNVLDLTSNENNCVISDSLASENELSVGDTFTLINPENKEESYTFTIVGIGDSTKSSDNNDTSSNASFEDNYIYVSYSAVEKIAENSSTLNGDATVENDDKKAIKLTPSYSAKFIFANLTDYNTFNKNAENNYNVISEDVSNYEESISQLKTLGKYATYFLIVIFIIGAFVLIIINLFSIRNRKYEIGVLTAIGMKKYKVATQFVIELFVVTFAALIIGSSIGAVSSVPVTNKLLKSINSSKTQEIAETDFENQPQMPNGNLESGKQNERPEQPSFDNFGGKTKSYIASVNSATNLTVILEMIVVGIGLTLISSLAAMLFVMRYEPLKILNNRD